MENKIVAVRYHDISCGHRVLGHENKCSNLHGHNYRIHFHCEANQLDKVGRVIDFGVIKEKLCMWLENRWDHRFIIYEKDPLADDLKSIDKTVVIVNFNPTAENMAAYLVNTIGPVVLEGTNVTLSRCIIEETRKCSAIYEKGQINFE